MISYNDGYNRNGNNQKIPYDDIPITRNTSGYNYKEKQKNRFSASKAFYFIVAILLVANVALVATMFYYLNHGKVKNVNTYYNTYQVTQDNANLVAINDAMNSTVCVASGGSCSSNYDFYNSTLKQGAGVIYRVVDNTIYFITCYHVVNGHNTFWVMLTSRLEPLAVELVSYSSQHDIAVLKYTATNAEDILDGCKPIKIYDTSYLSYAEVVYAIGNPLGWGLSVSNGVMSVINEQAPVEGGKKRELRLSAEINGGNSGGGLFNQNGYYVGMVNAKLHSSSKTDVDGVSYAIPGNFVISVAESIIKNQGSPTKIDLGLTLTHDETLGSSLNVVEVDGEHKPIMSYYVKVKSVSSGDANGKLFVNDIITKIEFDALVNGKVEHKIVDMYNMYILEDYSYSIIQNSKIKFYVEGKESPIEVIATKVTS